LTTTSRTVSSRSGGRGDRPHQSSPGPKVGRNLAGGAHEHRRSVVPILARPLEAGRNRAPVQLRRRPQLVPILARPPEAGRNDRSLQRRQPRVVPILARPEDRGAMPNLRILMSTSGFKSSPGSKAERNRTARSRSANISSFQSSPDPKAGRNDASLLTPRQKGVFRSSPDPKAGRTQPTSRVSVTPSGRSSSTSTE